MFGFAGDEIGKNKVRDLMIGLGACGETSILYELRLADVVTTSQFRRGGHRVSRSAPFGVISTRIHTD